MVVAREQYQALIARAFDGAIVVDGHRVVAHKSGMHVIRGAEPKTDIVRRPQPLDRENDWSDV